MVFETTFLWLAFVGLFMACESIHSSKLLLGVFTSFYVFLLLMCDSSVKTGKYLFCRPSLLMLNRGGDTLIHFFAVRQRIFWLLTQVSNFHFCCFSSSENHSELACTRHTVLHVHLQYFVLQNSLSCENLRLRLNFQFSKYSCSLQDNLLIPNIYLLWKIRWFENSDENMPCF